MQGVSEVEGLKELGRSVALDGLKWSQRVFPFSPLFWRFEWNGMDLRTAVLQVMDLRIIPVSSLHSFDYDTDLHLGSFDESYLSFLLFAGAPS